MLVWLLKKCCVQELNEFVYSILPSKYDVKNMQKILNQNIPLLKRKQLLNLNWSELLNSEVKFYISGF